MSEDSEPFDFDYPFHLTRGVTSSLSSEGEGWNGIIIDEIEVQNNAEAHLPELDYHFLSMILSGTSDVVQKISGTTSKGVLSAGDLNFMPAGDSSIWQAGKSHRTSLFRVPVSFCASAANQMGYLSGQHDLVNTFGARDFVTQQICSILVSELHQPRHPAQKLLVECASHALAAQLLRIFAAEVQTMKVPKGLPRRSLAKVIDYMNDHISDPIGLSELASVANVSRFHFARQFKLSTKMSAIAYLEISRIRRAEVLIRTGEMRLFEIAVAVGFADQSHFTRKFRRHTGYTPGEYRRRTGRG